MVVASSQEDDMTCCALAFSEFGQLHELSLPAPMVDERLGPLALPLPPLGRSALPGQYGGVFLHRPALLASTAESDGPLRSDSECASTQVFQDRVPSCSGRTAQDLRAAIGQMRSFDLGTLRSLAEHFGKQTVWRPAGRGKATEALTGYTMLQLVDIASTWDATRRKPADARPAKPPSTNEDAVAHAILDRIGTARMLIDFYWHDEDARQRGGGSNHPGGQFARTLDAHGVPRCGCAPKQCLGDCFYKAVLRGLRTRKDRFHHAPPFRAPRAKSKETVQLHGTDSAFEGCLSDFLLPDTVDAGLLQADPVLELAHLQQQDFVLPMPPMKGGSASFNNTVFEGSIASGSGSAEIPPSLRSGSSHVFVPSDAGGGAWEQQASEATPRKRPRLIGRAAQPQDVGKFRDNIPAQVKADLLHEVREFMRTRGIVGYATYGCIEVQFDPASASFTAEEVMRHLQAIMREHATPASLQIGDLLLSWDKGSVVPARAQLPGSTARIEAAWASGTGALMLAVANGESLLPDVEDWMDRDDEDDGGCVDGPDANFVAFPQQAFRIRGARLVVRARYACLDTFSTLDLCIQQRLAGDGFIAQVVSGLRHDGGDAQLQLMAGDVLLSAYDLPLADLACLSEMAPMMVDGQSERASTAPRPDWISATATSHPQRAPLPGRMAEAERQRLISAGFSANQTQDVTFRDVDRAVRRGLAETIREEQALNDIDPLEAVLVKESDGSDWELGAGSLGKVYKAIWQETTVVAVKMLLCKVDAAAERQIMADHETMFNLGYHPNIVQLYGVCPATAQNPVMLCMEFMEGGDLRTALWTDDIEGTFEWGWHQRGRAAAVDIAEGLNFLHSNGIVHRDVKSSNVLLTRDGAAKLADLGLAAVVGDGRDFQDISVGHFAYMAPELLLGLECTSKVDVFSFGVLLWELVTLEPPRRGNLRELEVPKECPVEVAHLIERCIQADPGKRPAMSDVLDTLLRAPTAQHHTAAVYKDSHLRRASRSAAVSSSAAAAAFVDARGCAIDALPPPLRRSAGSAAGWYSAYQASLLEEASRAASFDHRRPRLRRSAGSAACSFFGAFTTAPSLPVKDAGGEGSSRAASIDSRGLCWNGIPNGGRAAHTDLDARSWTSETCSGVTLQSSSHWAAGA